MPARIVGPGGASAAELTRASPGGRVLRIDVAMRESRLAIAEFARARRNHAHASRDCVN
jgi:hypothetical protein